MGEAFPGRPLLVAFLFYKPPVGQRFFEVYSFPFFAAVFLVPASMYSSVSANYLLSVEELVGLNAADGFPSWRLQQRLVLAVRKRQTAC